MGFEVQIALEKNFIVVAHFELVQNLIKVGFEFRTSYLDCSCMRNLDDFSNPDCKIASMGCFEAY
jgi:hypothetical protein